jgi:methionyl-tRNA formyltransferase
MIRTLFFGTSPFAVPSLEALAADERFSIVGVVTQPDRPVGRHAELTAPPIKFAAQRLGLPVFQFASVKQVDALKTLTDLQPEIGIVVSFGQILPQALLEIPLHGMVNVHGSILPRHRGASPIQAAIREGDTTSGVTIMCMDALLDHGPILATAEAPIQPNDTGGILQDRLALLGAQLLPDTLFAYVQGSLQPVEQDHASATMTKLLKREHGLIDWSLPAMTIERMVRAYDPWPGTYTMEHNARLKILGVSLLEKPGYPIKMCGDGQMLWLTRVQPEGKSAMDGQDYARGRNRQ